MWNEIGTVFVDSGRVSLIKEKDIALWSGSGKGKPISLAFWGRDDEKVAHALKEKEVPVLQSGTLYYFHVNAEAIQLYKELAEQEDTIVVHHLVSDNPYDRLFLEEKKVMTIQSHSDEKFYTTSTFIGDGIYPVLTNGNDYLVAFVDGNLDTRLTEKVDSFVLEEPTSYSFVDPCYLDRGTDSGTTVNLQANVEYEVLILKEVNNLPTGLWIKANL